VPGETEPRGRLLASVRPNNAFHLVSLFSLPFLFFFSYFAVLVAIVAISLFSRFWTIFLFFFLSFFLARFGLDVCSFIFTTRPEFGCQRTQLSKCRNFHSTYNPAKRAIALDLLTPGDWG